MLVFLLCILLICLGFFIVNLRRNANKKKFFLTNQADLDESVNSDLFKFDGGGWLSSKIKRYKELSGDSFVINVVLLLIFSIVSGVQLNNLASTGFIGFIFFTPLLIIFVFTLAFKFLSKKHLDEFVRDFPDAIAMLSSAVSSGESLPNALKYVSENVTTAVGKDFKWMSDRLVIGDAPERVFKEALNRAYFDEYVFFISALKVNLNMGGQLSVIIKKIDRIVFNSYAIKKKTLALTSEARTSAKIVAALPFCFLGIMRYLSKENFDYIFETSIGNMLLAYVVISIIIGMGIIKYLMSGIR